MWNSRKAVVSRRIVHEGQAYIPLHLNPSVRRALRLPSGSSPIDSTASLFAQLVAVTGRFTNLAEHVCCQLVAFIFASLAGGLPPRPR